MHADLRTLLDERAIRDVLVRYCRGVDRCDEALIRSCYHPGAVDEHGAFRGDGDAFAAFVVEMLRRHFAATQHQMGNVHIVFEAGGAAARVESQVLAIHRTHERDGVHQLISVGGRYLDRFECRDGDWRLARRVVVVDWSRMAPVEATFPDQGYHRGARWPDDPVYGDFQEGPMPDALVERDGHATIVSDAAEGPRASAEKRVPGSARR